MSTDHNLFKLIIDLPTHATMNLIF